MRVRNGHQTRDSCFKRAFCVGAILNKLCHFANQCVQIWYLIVFCMLVVYISSMPNVCAVAGCSSANKQRIKRRLFCFPKDEQLRSLWEMRCGREGWKSNIHSRICEFHFDSTQFLSEYPSKRLKEDAVPTRFQVLKKREQTCSSSTKRARHVEHSYAASNETHLIQVLKEKIKQLENEKDILLKQLSEMVDKCQDVETSKKSTMSTQTENWIFKESIKSENSIYEESTRISTMNENNENKSKIPLLPSLRIKPEKGVTYQLLNGTSLETDTSVCQTFPGRGHQETSVSPVEDKKFIVFEPQLLDLYSGCPEYCEEIYTTIEV